MLKFNESSNPNFDESDLKENANVHLAKKIWKVGYLCRAGVTDVHYGVDDGNEKDNGHDCDGDIDGNDVVVIMIMMMIMVQLWYWK